MNTSIRQLLPCDMDAVIAFLRSLAGEAAPSADAPPVTDQERQALADVNPRISLIASDGNDAILGVALCRAAQQPGEPCRLQIKVAPQHSDLARTLVDKALLKLHARGIHKCRIMLGDDEPNDIWHATRWLDHLPEGETQAA